jgi:hypothetical protein
MSNTGSPVFHFGHAFRARVLEERHLPRWNEAADDPLTRKWLEISWDIATMNLLGPVDPAEWAQDAREGWGIGLRLAVEDATLELQVALVLMGANWLHGPDCPSIEVAVACHPSARGQRLGRDAVIAAVNWVGGFASIDHVCARVCDSNANSQSLVAATPMKLIRVTQPCVSRHLHDCADEEAHYCTCGVPSPAVGDGEEMIGE